MTSCTTQKLREQLREATANLSLEEPAHAPHLPESSIIESGRFVVIDETELVDDWLGTIRGDVRETLRGNRIGYLDLNQNLAARSVSVRLEAAHGNRRGV